MAANDGLVLDEDGDSSDWIEIHNDSTAAVNLIGWHLTDDPANLAKWSFPATNLAPNGYLVVFASGKDRAQAGRELHTNFQLDSAGEFLALVEPDGATVAYAFSPVFLPQRANVSYGIERADSVTPLLRPGAAARVLVPTDGSLSNTWTGAEFDDSGWFEGTTGVGFESGNSGDATNAVGRVVLQLDFNDDDSGESGAANTETGFNEMTLSTNPGTFNGVSVTLTPLGGGVLDDRDRATPVDALPDFSQDQLYDDFIFVNGQTNGNGMAIRLTGLIPNGDYFITIWSFDTGSVGARVSDWIETASGVTNTIVTGYTFDGNALPSRDGDDTFSGYARASAVGELQIEGRRSGGTSHGVFLNALQLAEVGYDSLINTDVSGTMSNHNASAYVRIPFTVSDPGAFQALRLRMKYDDGYAAYLNGQLVTSRNAPSSLLWNSSATVARPNADALAYEDFVIANSPGLLVSGTNVLAVHGLNVSAGDTDFLILPELDGIVTGQERSGYFSLPTPGADNAAGYSGFVAEPQFSVGRGFYSAPFPVVITSATAGADIYWTADGSAPSEANGELYTGPITITNTAFLRAAAFLPGWLPSEALTQTYVFLDQVIHQSATQPACPATWQASYPADYGMDPNVVDDPGYGATLKNDLRSIPTLSVVTDHASLWDPSSGIYVDATRTGELWERAASVELFNGDNTTSFHVNCGLRMQGNASRDNVRTPKHSFRLLFKSAYGPSKLRYDWFPGSPVSEFDNIVLRACFTDSWPTRYSPGDGGTRYRPEDSIYLRDVWVKDSLADMGQLSGGGNFVHLYINGLYWGLYNVTERLDASFFAEHLGGNKEDWDVIRDFSEVLDGNKDDWNQMMAIVNAGITNETAFQAVASLVDVDNLIDYMMLHIFAEAEDWPQHNWYAAHRRATNGLPATKWIFLAWDQEIVLDQLVRRNRIDVNNNDTPARIYSQLRAYPEFRRLFGDRVQKHLFNGGALTPARNVARLKARASQIDRAIVGESARWGDAREFPISPNAGTGQTFARDEWWVPELQKLYTNFFATLNATNVGRFRAGDLYPTIGAPEFNQFGGLVAPDFELTITHTNASGSIYFTLDGTDPRVYGTGAIAPSAGVFAAPISFAAPTLVRARVLSGSEWSALVEATFYPPQDFSRLLLTEIMYHPPDAGLTNGDEFEFVELKNGGTNTLDLSGLAFTTGISFVFTNGTTLAPGAYFVLARDPMALSAKYPAAAVDGIYTGKLDNGGESLTLSAPFGLAVLSVSYDDVAPWPAAADGTGLSLQLVSDGQGYDAANWIAAPPTPGLPIVSGDADGDGLPDDWEIAFGTQWNVPDSDADPDQDGLTNMQEFVAGTDPNDPESTLRLLRVTVDNGSVALEFSAVSNRTYSVLYKSVTAAGVWNKLADVPARPGNRLETVTDNAPLGAARFYRLVTPAQP